MESVKKKFLWFLSAIVVCCIVSVSVPAVNGLTPMGVKMLGVFLATVVLWLTVNDRFAVLCFSMTGVVAVVGMPYKDDLATSIINDSTVICFLALLLAEALNETGAMEYLSKWLLSRKIVEGHPYVFMLFIMLAGIILGMLTATGMSVVFIFTFTVQLLKTAKIDRKNPIFVGTILGILWTYAFSEMALPYKSVSAQFVMGLGTGLGYPVSNGQFAMIGLPLMVVSLAASLLLIRLFLHPSKKDFSNYDVSLMKEELAQKPMTPAAKAALSGTFLCFGLLLIQSFTFIPFIRDRFAPLGSLVCYWIPLIGLSLANFDGKPVLNISASLKKISWDMVFFMANIMLFATTIAKAEFGITACVQNLMLDMVDSVSPMVLFCIALILIGLFTNISSNYALASLGCAIFVPLLANTNISPSIAVIGIGQAAFFAFVTPAGGLGPAVIFGSGEISVKKAFLPSSIMLAIMLGATILICCASSAVCN